MFFANGASGTLTSQTVTVNGTAKPTTLIAKTDATFGPFMLGSYCFYTDPLASASTITVDIAGTIAGAPFTRSWSFTTQ